MVRAFVAVDISGEARAALAQVIERLRQQTGFSGVRWVKPEGVHLTLKFLGGIPETQVETVLSAMQRAALGTGALTLALSEIGAFPNVRNPRVLWVGLAGDLDSLKALHRRLDHEIHIVTGLPLEKRAFSPHLTLARVRDTASGGERRRIGQALSEVTQGEAEIGWKVSAVNLMQSTLKPSGAVYEVLGSKEL